MKGCPTRLRDMVASRRRLPARRASLHCCRDKSSRQKIRLRAVQNIITALADDRTVETALLGTDDDCARGRRLSFVKMNKHVATAAFNGRVPQRMLICRLVAVN